MQPTVYPDIATTESRVTAECTSPTDRAKRILVVEDDAEVLALTIEMLGCLGHWATGVSSAEAAKTRYLEGAFDLLVTDVGLPGLSGLQLAESFGVQHGLPVLIVSGSPPPYGFDTQCWLQKPFDMAQLATMIERCAHQPAQLGKLA